MREGASVRERLWGDADYERWERLAGRLQACERAPRIPGTALWYGVGLDNTSKGAGVFEVGINEGLCRCLAASKQREQKLFVALAHRGEVPGGRCSVLGCFRRQGCTCMNSSCARNAEDVDHGMACRHAV